MLILEKYQGKNSRFPCPSCGKPNQFTRYIKTETGEYIHETVGKCNREIKCGYHYKPREYFTDNPEAAKHHYNTLTKSPALPAGRQRPKANSISPTYIDMKLVEQSMCSPNSNNLIRYLYSFLNPETVFHLSNIYYIGTSRYFGGGTTVFWQIDSKNRVRSGKLIHYNANTGHRHKQTSWVHAVHPEYKKPNKFNLQQCLFGEHLLQYDKSSPIALVESEKTAIIAMAKMPQYLWMATGCLGEFKASKLEILKNRVVMAFPDLGAYEKWEEKAASLSFKIQISDYLERNASEEEKEKGLDLGDYLIVE